MNTKEICGTCRHNCYDIDGSGVRQHSGFYCGNDRSETAAALPSTATAAKIGRTKTDE